MPTRQEIIKYITDQYYDLNFNIMGETPLKLLSILYNCKCTDCGGSDNICECLIEKDYYNKKKNKKIFTEITYL